MKAEVNKIIKDYLNMGGLMGAEDFLKILKAVTHIMRDNVDDNEAYLKLEYIQSKLLHGLELTYRFGEIIVVVDDTEETLEKYYEKHKHGLGKMKPPKHRVKQNAELGKLVDEGDVPYPDRADAYWKKEDRLKVVFQPDNKAIRSGSDIPSGYLYADMKFIEVFYDLRAIEFGNWLSQQDRVNYVAALGLGLYDLHRVLGLKPEQLSLGGRLAVAFGARGRGSALAHFEPHTFTINITRYQRPPQGSHKKKGYQRTNFLTQSGGVGSFAHEYGHALDYFAGIHVLKTKSGALSGGSSERTTPDNKMLKQDNIAGYMERLLNKIIWKTEGKHTAYYERLLKDETLTKYYFQRNEIFARAFEVYVQYKMQKKGWKNIFLAETKYASDVYLTPTEMKPLEKDFDTLIKAIQKKIK